MSQVQFKVDLGLDIAMVIQFLGFGEMGGVDFSQSILNIHPELIGIDIESNKGKKKVDEVLRQYYDLNIKAIEEKVREFQLLWDLVNDKFFKAMEGLFNQHNLVDTTVEAYISVVDCNPRFVEELSFQVWINKENPIAVTAHELMHFAFYQYTEENLPDLVQGKDKNNGLWWHVSEIFNNVVLDSSEFREVLGGYFEAPYPDHEKYLDQAKVLYSEANGDVNMFIGNLFKMVEDSELTREQTREKGLD